MGRDLPRGKSPTPAAHRGVLDAGVEGTADLEDAPARLAEAMLKYASSRRFWKSVRMP
ncbi:hypothetical protein KCP70_21280 [Salmonella enterica subsp. enterica]|nr:hypothetical protein KCP70_21280 [Salmonella enterica subsp. enterica]